MKTLFLSLLTFAAIGFAQEKEVPLSDIGEAFQRMNEATSFVVKINPGDVLPLNFHISGGVLKLENPPENGVIKALQPLYVKIEPNFLFSTDKKEWKSFESFFTGEFGVAVGSHGNPNGEISFRLEKR
jgi:hypothetical protein